MLVPALLDILLIWHMKQNLATLFQDFFHSEKIGGVILILCTLLSISIANSSFGESYLHIWHQEIGFSLSEFSMYHPMEYWINDGLMAIFFLLIGLEIEREIYIGELSDWKNALLPIFAAIGGMAIPALLHLSFNVGTATQSGIGIPMATDIAFALGVLSLLGNKVPVSLKIFLAALAIIDDLGAIVVIAIFYSKGFSLTYFSIAIGIFIVLYIMGRLKVYNLFFYIVPGVVMWYCMLQSGIHATISGVLLAFAIPFGNGEDKSPSHDLQHFLHKPVAFLILPLFALANTGIVFVDSWKEGFSISNSLGILSGLVLGKPLGIFSFTLAAVKFGVCKLPSELNWKHVAGVGMLGGIGFTMSIFISLLAFDNAALVTNSKISVLTGSVVSGMLGYFYFFFMKESSSNKKL